MINLRKSGNYVLNLLEDLNFLRKEKESRDKFVEEIAKKEENNNETST